MTKGQVGSFVGFLQAMHYGRLLADITSHRGIRRVQAFTAIVGFLMEMYYLKFNGSRISITALCFNMKKSKTEMTNIKKNTKNILLETEGDNSPKRSLQTKKLLCQWRQVRLKLSFLWAFTVQ